MVFFIKIYLNTHQKRLTQHQFYEKYFKKSFYTSLFNARTGSMNFKGTGIIRGIRNYDFTPSAAPVSVICPSCQTEIETTELKERKGMVGCINCLK